MMLQVRQIGHYAKDCRIQIVDIISIKQMTTLLFKEMTDGAATMTKYHNVCRASLGMKPQYSYQLFARRIGICTCFSALKNTKSEHSWASGFGAVW